MDINTCNDKNAEQPLEHPSSAAPTQEEYRAQVRAFIDVLEQHCRKKADAETNTGSTGDDDDRLQDFASCDPGVQIYTLADVEARRQALRQRDDSDSAGRIRAILDLMKKRGGWRPLRTLPADWRQQLDEVEASFPNCARLLDHLRGQAALAERGDGALPRLNILLDGPPGVGKTIIVEAIAPIIGGGFRRISLASAQSSSELAGSSEFWGNSRPGEVFELLVKGEYGNPVIQLDEIDKVSGDLPYNPVAALYDLLEPTTASGFRDLSMPSIALDASRVIWIGTSNQRRFIQRPILDRLTLIEIAEPKRVHMPQIIASVDRAFHASNPSVGSMRLSEAAARALGTLPPRRIWRALADAYGRAAYRGREVVLPEDLPRLDDAVPAIGFR